MLEATVDKCLAFCQALAQTKQKFTLNLSMGQGKGNFSFSTNDQCRKVPASKSKDLKKALPNLTDNPPRGEAGGRGPPSNRGGPSHKRRREKRAADREAAAEKAAAERATAGAEQAAAAAEKAAAEQVAAAAEKAAAEQATAGAAGEAARPGPKCSKCNEPTKGHTTGRAGPQCTALPRPERARGSSHAVMDTSLELSPVKVDGRQEFNTDVASEQEEERLQVQVKEEHWPPWDAYRLMLDCENDVHDEYCCSMPEGMDQAPSPLPARVFHPYLDITGVYDPAYRDPYQPKNHLIIAAYKFVMRDGREFYRDCFEL
jgi:hypothetical protein